MALVKLTKITGSFNGPSFSEIFIDPAQVARVDAGGEGPKGCVVHLNNGEKVIVLGTAEQIAAILEQAK